MDSCDKLLMHCKRMDGLPYKNMLVIQTKSAWCKGIYLVNHLNDLPSKGPTMVCKCQIHTGIFLQIFWSWATLRFRYLET